ncbi:natriuretic peptide receptor 1 [Echinococcus multilocularis]|uniref:Natriuretic peptide receptor 1 n=1 Tax=Echinococcus multilocularis TaxID=6211 RepID=A0A068Y1M9_ECHMU|nr:natriuretic peptide receptor 1 [Echinococcus multilocularis]
MVLAGLIVVTQVDVNKDPPDLPFSVAGTENTRLLWQRLLQSYGQSWRSRLTIVPLISAISRTDTSTPSKSLEKQSALLADSTANPNYVSANYSILPSAFAPLVFYYNLPELSRDVKITLSLSDISDIFTGKLRYWSDIRIRQRNPDLPFIGQPIHLILENIALTEFLCNSSDIWQLQYGLMSSMQDFKAPSSLSVYHTILPSGGFSLVNSVPYSIAYFLGTVPSLTAISLQLQNGITVNVSGFECNKTKSKNDSVNASEAIYPLVYTFYIIFRKDLPATPYNVTVLAKDPLRRFSTACRLQVELYRFLHWLTSSESSEILKFHGFCQIKGENMLMDLNEMSCRNSRDLTVSAEKLANEETHLRSRIWGHFVDSKEDYRDFVFTFSTTAVILFVVSVVLTYYLCSHHHPISEYIIDIEKMDPSGNSDAFQTSLHDFQMKNSAFLEYAFENNSDRNSSNPYCASKNCGKSVINTWVYADSILSTTPVSGQYKGADVLLKPTNIRSTMKFMEKGRLKLQKYTSVDHENVQLFYGLAKSSVTKNKIRCSILAAHLKGMRKKQRGARVVMQGYSESDFILPWIYYIIVEPCVRGSLFELLHSGQYEVSQSIKLNLASDIASGMAYLHSKKLIHGRLSSLTCLLDSRWVIKIACWQNVEELVQSESFYNKHSANRGFSRCCLRICWQPEHLRLLWRSPAQLKSFITAHRSTRTVDNILSRRDHAETKRGRATEPVGTDAEEGTGSEYESMACDVYSFGVILTEIWNLEVPFQAALDVYQRDYQLAEAICNKVCKLSISPNMPSKIREATESCVDHSEKQRPSFRSILKTLASLVPKERSVAHHMIRAAVARLVDLDASCALREREVAKRKAHMCQKLDRLFPRDYSQGLVTGTLTPSTVAKPQDVLLAVVSLDQAFLQSAALADETTVLHELQCLKQIAEKHSNDPLLRCLASPGGFENDGVCFVAMVHGDVSTPGMEEVKMIVHLLRVICQVEREFTAAKAFHPASHPKFCAVLHRAKAVSGPLGAYLPCQFVYGSALEDVSELKRYAKAMEVLVTSEVTTKIKYILKEFKDYALTETHKVQLWGTKPLQLYVLR